jgi:hypothetical protein
MKNNGVIIVATCANKYYNSACYLASTIKEYCPEINVTLFTQDDFLDNKAKYFDNVITDLPFTGDFVIDRRLKMWAMGNSPYDTTLYLDADMEVMSEEFSTVFDQIKDNDMLWTGLNEEVEYAWAPRIFGDVEYTVHGAVCLYKSTAKQFMLDWFDLFVKQNSGEWWPEGNYPRVIYDDKDGDTIYQIKMFDQFPLWWLLNKESDKYKYLKYDFFDDWTRWNAIQGYEQKLGHGVNPIICHFTLN